MTRKSVRCAVVALTAVLLAPPACRDTRPPATAPDAAHAEAAGAAGTPPDFVAVPPSEIPREMPAGVSPPGALSTEAIRPPYVVAVEDVLEISVYGDPELTRTIPVRPDGKISYTFIGDVDAAGRGIDEIRAELKQRLSSYLRSPEVTVIAKEFGRPKVYVGGEVRAPGVFFLSSRENTLADVFFKAGLVTEKADIAKAVLVRGGHIVEVDFARMIRGDISLNVSLQNGDLVYVPEASERYVYALGEVRTQGAIETSVPLSVLNVLARSGGVNQGAAKSKEIAILRGGLKDPKVAVVNFKRLIEGDLSQNVMVLPGDIVYVPTTALGKYNQFLEQILRTLTFLFQGRVVQQSLR